jgi:sodium transport system ATP-binding protein
LIEARELSKVFNRRRRNRVEALKGVSFTCQPGEVFGLLGPNGAGKTTTLRIISTALKPTGGSATVMGFELERQPAQIRRCIGFLSANTGLYGRLTPREVLFYFGRLYQIEKAQIVERINELAELLEMQDFLNRTCDTLSAGMRQKVNIARAVFHSPQVMVFDEPTASLDVLTSRTIISFIRRCRERGKTVILSTHIMSEVERLCDRLAVIHQGRLCFQGTVGELRQTWGDDLDDAFLRVVEEGAAT